jgi:kynureninase
MIALDGAMDVFDAVDVLELERKSQALSEFFITEVERRVPEGEIALASPRDPALRGSQVSFRCPHAYAVSRALIAEDVIGDFRAPDLMRFGFAPLYLRFVDVADAAFRLAEILHERRWDQPAHHAKAAVT